LNTIKAYPLGETPPLLAGQSQDYFPKRNNIPQRVVEAMMVEIFDKTLCPQIF